ncbi:MAG: hypothetical protein U0174_13235 [Polyangiaceae bacterium]
MSANNVKSRFRGAGLSLVPVAVCVLLAGLLLPRAAVPDDVPLPVIDERALLALEAEDDARQRQVDEAGLSGDVRALGSDLRAFHELQAEGARDMGRLLEAKDRVFASRARVVSGEGVELVHKLFSVQLARFKSEVAAYRASGEESLELRALSGTFLARMRSASWVVGRDVRLTDAELRVLYKSMWALDVGLDSDPTFSLTLDEKRVLYRLFLRSPHPSEQLRGVFVEAKRRANGTVECGRVLEEERLSAEKWRIQKILQLAELDPAYPKDYALGAAFYRAGDYGASVQAYRRFLDTHADGPLVLRARNFYRGALAANNAVMNGTPVR